MDFDVEFDGHVFVMDRAPAVVTLYRTLGDGRYLRHIFGLDCHGSERLLEPGMKVTLAGCELISDGEWVVGDVRFPDGPRPDA